MKKRNSLFSFCLAFFILTSSVTASLSVSAKDTQNSVISPGICVIAEENSMAMAALRGNSIKFDSEDFARALNISKVEKITLTQAPPTTDGELRVGSTVLNEGQILPRVNRRCGIYAFGTRAFRREQEVEKLNETAGCKRKSTC